LFRRSHSVPSYWLLVFNWYSRLSVTTYKAKNYRGTKSEWALLLLNGIILPISLVWRICSHLSRFGHVGSYAGFQRFSLLSAWVFLACSGQRENRPQEKRTPKKKAKKNKRKPPNPPHPTASNGTCHRGTSRLTRPALQLIPSAALERWTTLLVDCGCSAPSGAMSMSCPQLRRDDVRRPACASGGMTTIGGAGGKRRHHHEGNDPVRIRHITAAPGLHLTPLPAIARPVVDTRLPKSWASSASRRCR